MAKKKNAKQLKREYDALKQTKSRAATKAEKAQIQKAIDAKVQEMNNQGLNTRGTVKQPQGGTQARCFCSAADLATKGHRPNCPSNR